MKSMALLRGGLVLGSIVVLSGCPAPQPLCETSESIEPQMQPQDGADGKPGTNGLDSATFHRFSSDLLEATKVPLTESLMKDEVHPVSQAIQDVFLTDGSMDDIENGKAIREAIFDHAIQCALKEGASLVDGDKLYHGKGLLTTTGDWLVKGLPIEAAEDLFTCVAILLNPDWQGVPVFLSGPSVAKPDVPFPHIEALWTVDLSEGRPIYHVWPILDVKGATTCWGEDAGAGDPWRFRVCGSNTEDCSLDVREDRENECEEVDFVVNGEAKKDGSHFYCSAPPMPGGTPVKKPAIRTALKTLCDANSLFCPTAN